MKQRAIEPFFGQQYRSEHVFMQLNQCIKRKHMTASRLLRWREGTDPGSAGLLKLADTQIC